MPLPEAHGPRRAGQLVLIALVACSSYDPTLLDGVEPRGGGGAASRGPDGFPGAEVTGGNGGASGLGGAPSGSTGAPDAHDGGVEVPSCGDGEVGADERCDVAIAAGAPGACPTECPAPDPCLPRELQGSDCQASCVIVPPECAADDGCCPAGCSSTQDADCSSSCGDGVVQPENGESCETALDDAGAGQDACPSECPDDGDACTVELLMGSPDNCNATCTMTVIEGLDDDDGCCPRGANSTVDDDCPVLCGNGVIEAGEDCDGSEDCDEQCHFATVSEERRCLNVFADGSTSCRDCMCAACTAVVNDCFDSGDAARDADCAELVYCGLAAGCRGSQCYCGFEVDPDGTCLVGDGPCAALLDRIAGTPGPLSVYNQQFDTSTAIGRARAFSDCDRTMCPSACP